MKYLSFEGKEVKWIWAYGQSCTGIVTGCDKSIGITIQNKDPLNHYLLCLNGPLSPVKIKNRHSKRTYHKIFLLIIEGIKKGEIEAYKLGREIEKYFLRDKLYRQPSKDSCPFAQ